MNLKISAVFWLSWLFPPGYVFFNQLLDNLGEKLLYFPSKPLG